MHLVRKWNEYMGPKDERLETESCRYMKISFYMLLAGIIICLYYSIMLEQVSWTTETAIYTAAGEGVFPVNQLMIIVVLLACAIPFILQIKAGIISNRSRYASVERIPWGFVALVSFVCAMTLGVLTCGMRMVAEIQIVGIENVAWLGDVAMGIVFFIMAFVLAMFFMGEAFSVAIKNRRHIEAELEEEEQSF